MMVMCGQSNQMWHYLSGKYSGKIGQLFGPDNLARQTIRWWMPYALDNDAFQAWSKQKQWDESAWLEMIAQAKVSGIAPLWILVPDVVADRKATLESWKKYHSIAGKHGWPLAFAVQDGMSVEDVPDDADVVFVGGSTEWKWRTVPMWCKHFNRVHVGRVNAPWRLPICERLGVESVDGSGWFMGGPHVETNHQIRGLLRWLEGDLKEEPMFEQLEV